ncbi:MAG: hypothetical protein LBQ81_11135, partial [Zoogloeaceae bacterium]|nr:hypothetical protein [Zoogloeaceae bacterium]
SCYGYEFYSTEKVDRIYIRRIDDVESPDDNSGRIGIKFAGKLRKAMTANGTEMGLVLIPGSGQPYGGTSGIGTPTSGNLPTDVLKPGQPIVWACSVSVETSFYTIRAAAAGAQVSKYVPANCRH